MSASDLVWLCDRLVHCECVETGHEAIYAMQRARVLREEEEEWVVTEEAIESLGQGARERLETKLTGLRDSLRLKRAETPGLAERLDQVTKRLETASYDKRWKAYKVHLETKMRDKIDKRLDKLKVELQERNVRLLEWQVYNAKVDNYIRRRAYAKAINLPRPKDP